MSIQEIENKLSQMNIGQGLTQDYKWKKPAKVKRLEKKVMKKPDYVLVEYLTQRYEVRRLMCKVVGGNIIVVDNKVHTLNPKHVWRDGKNVWYKIREIDRLPVSNEDYDKLIEQKRITVNDSVIIKAILGAVQKKELSKSTRNLLFWLIGLAVVGFVIYIFFFAK